MKNPLGLILLLACLLIGCWLRWQMAAHDPLWIDELHTSWVLADGWGQVASRAIAGNQSPLYFWLNHVVAGGQEQTAFGLRAVSLAAGCGLLGLGAWVTWRLTRSVLATATTALVLAIDSQLIFFASEARPYALVQLGGLLLSWRGYQRLCSLQTGPDWSLPLLALAIVLLHPTAILLTLTVAVLLFFQRRAPQPLDGLGMAVGSVVGLVMNQATSTWVQRRELWQALVDGPELIGLSLGLVLGAWLVPYSVRRWYAFRTFRWNSSSRVLSSPARSPRSAEPSLAVNLAGEPEPSAAAYWLGCFLGPVIVAVLCSWSGLAGLATPRYLAVVWSFPALGLGLQVAGLPWKRGLALSALGVFLLAFGAVPVPQSGGWRIVRTNPLAVSLWRERAVLGMRSEGWHDVRQYLLDSPDLNQRLLWLYPNLIEDELWERSDGKDDRLNEYLTFALRGIYSLPKTQIEPRAFRAAQLLDQADQSMLRGRAICVVVRCAAEELANLEQAWRADWARLGGQADELQIEWLLSAGDVHLLTIEVAAQPGRAEQPQ
ncbi:MAG: hypothetical protein ACK56J_18200 [Planctomycetota bacterium]